MKSAILLIYDGVQFKAKEQILIYDNSHNCAVTAQYYHFNFYNYQVSVDALKKEQTNFLVWLTSKKREN